MARPKSFDVDEVLDRAVEVFWLNGLAATSVEDLVTHLGINRGSLYATFDSKEELYRRALDRYHSDSMVWMRQMLLVDEPPLRSRLEMMLLEAGSSDDHRGCFMLNTATERNSVDDQCRSLTGDAVQEILDVFTQAFERAVTVGGAGNELAGDLTPAQAATTTFTMLQGLRAMATMAPTDVRPDPSDTASVVLDSLFAS